MTDLLPRLQELEALPPELHWFCPLGKRESENTADETKITASDKSPLEIDRRRESAIQVLLLFGYDGEDVIPHQRRLTSQIDRQLGRCDSCLVEYYRAKRGMIERLRHDYDEDEVSLLVKIFDKQDFERIKRGLDRAAETLEQNEERSRSRGVLDLTSQMSLFEALCCEAFLQDHGLVNDHLDKPLRLVQTNRRLQVPRFVPAMTYFLFDRSYLKCSWAIQSWSKIETNLTKDDFDFAVRDPLVRHLKALSEAVPEPLAIQQLWCGLHLIVDKLDNDLVTHSLQAMEVDVCRLSLDHLQFPTPALRFVLQTIQKLLEIAPQDFWDSMGPISPTTVLEQIFNNAQYDSYMLEAQETENFESSALKDMLSWIEPFMASLQTLHQAKACRSIMFQLMDRLQADRFPAHAKRACCRIGLSVLGWTLSNCDRADLLLSHTGRIVALECLEIASAYVQRIFAILALPLEDSTREDLEQPALNVVKDALALECKSIRTDQESLRRKRDLSNGYCSYTPSIWDAVVHHLDRGDLALAKAALDGIKDLAGLEKFKIDIEESYTKEQSAFNVTFGHLTHLICVMLERINDFNPLDLDRLFGQSETATALVAALFSPDPSIYEAGVNLIKTISSEGARKEAIGHLLRPLFDTTLNSFSWSVERIARNRTYTSCPRMLTTLGDVLDVLTDPQSGLIRTETLSSARESKAIQQFWNVQWDALKVMYEMTEAWSRMKVSDTETLKEFCRDTMQFSDRLFDQYSIFASALDVAHAIKQDDSEEVIEKPATGRILLERPASTMHSMVRWLRLRDPYLASTSAKIIKKVLNRLTEAGMRLSEGATEFLESTVLGDSLKKTTLTAQEKAEIGRALEKNLGRPLSTRDDELGSDSSRASGSRGSGAVKKNEVTVLSSTKIEGLKSGDSSRASSVGSLDQRLKKTSKAQQTARQGANLNSVSKVNGTSFKEKREREREEKRKRDAEALAKIKQRSQGKAEQTLGVEGKDHAPSGPSMMVSSDSESESEDHLDQEIFGPKNTTKMSEGAREYELSRFKARQQQGPIKKMRQHRSAKDMRARLAPDLGPLHQIILGWDYFHDRDFPPGLSGQDYNRVPNRFRSPHDYQEIFEPLLILEAWNGFLKSREDGNLKPFEIKIANRMTVDSFSEVSTTIPMSDGTDISEADIILMSKAQSPTTKSEEAHCLARVHRITRKKGVLEVSYRVRPGNSLVGSMAPNATIYGVKIMSITPLEREYGALLGLKYFDLCEEIIKAKPSPILKYSEKQIMPLVTTYKVNVAQAKAIKSAIDNDAFTLIQGPPGSGKTKTIVAIVGALLGDHTAEKGVAVAPPASFRPQSSQAVAVPVSKKLLVCAPSNAAVDELVMRFKDGIRTMKGESRKISVVRLGRSDAINSNVKDVTLDELVNAKLNLTNEKKTVAGDDVNQIMLAHKATCEEFNALRTEVDEMKAQGKPATPEQERNFEVLKRKKQQLSNDIDATRDKGNIVARDAEINRRQIQQNILDNAHVICATLSGSGHDMFQSLNIEFDTVVIDEAAQSIELSALIPLKYGCSKCILVGDPKQLPPTVLSREAARFQFEQSLFVRMQVNHPDDIHLLDTQYRMHPEISAFPSSAFYDKKLLDGPDMLSLRHKPWHKSDLLGPYRFFDVAGQHKAAPRGHSLINRSEIEVALGLYHRLTNDCEGYNFDNKIGIITPYKSQLRELKVMFGEKYGRNVLETVEFNTTDAFQGRESEVIIFSCVRASANQGIGFLDDIRRMNVGITRAKSSLWLLGNSQSLMRGEYWARLISDARSRGCFTDGNLMRLLETPLRQLSTREIGPIDLNVRHAEDSDVEMVDAPTNGVPASRSRKSSMSHGQNAPYDPGGGRNGLNILANCQKCGSAAHKTHLCKELPVLCGRCGQAGHAKDKCVVERCQQCGEFGHSSKLCYSRSNLSPTERMQLTKAETSHKRYIDRLPEIRAQRQLGDHAKTVPVVRTTVKSPTSNRETPEQSQSLHTKRKREGSPPLGVSSLAKVRGSLGTNRGSTETNSHPRFARAPSRSDANAFSTPRPDQSHIKDNQAPKSLDLSTVPGSMPTTGKKLAVNRLGTVPKPVRPPIKKRKEADPFIRPKRR